MAVGPYVFFNTMATFEELGINDELLLAVAELGFETPMSDVAVVPQKSMAKDVAQKTDKTVKDIQEKSDSIVSDMQEKGDEIIGKIQDLINKQKGAEEA